MKQKPTGEEYSIEEIIDFKIENGREYLLIWWEGYPKCQATWEPAENISHIPNFQEYYDELKQVYMLKKHLHRRSQKQKGKTHSHYPPVAYITPKKTKPISKSNRKENDLSEGSSMNSHSKGQQNWQMYQQLAEQFIKHPHHKQSSKDPLKQMIRRAPPVHFEIRIKQFKDLPLKGQKLKAIKSAFVREDGFMYEVELESLSYAQPIILHENYIKVLWPRQFAEYLLTKVKAK